MGQGGLGGGGGGEGDGLNLQILTAAVVRMSDCYLCRVCSVFCCSLSAALY